MITDFPSGRGNITYFLEFAGQASSNVALLELKFFEFGFVWVWKIYLVCCIIWGFFNNEELNSSMKAV